MDASVTAGWAEFLLAEAAAAGALAGLVFVALSINLSRIIEAPGVSGRAAETLMVLGGALVASLIGLIPGQSADHLAFHLFLVGFFMWAIPTVIQVNAIRHRHYIRPAHAISRFIFHQVATVPMMLASLSLWGVPGGGLYWLGFGLIALLVLALINAWVLLVEIMR